ncbi:MAG: FG-GAP repeat domain-containing protein, partial [Planctomycetota bacterium]
QNLDVAVTNRDGDNVFVLLNTLGDGSFPDVVELAVGSEPSDLAAADFSGNTFIDLVVANAGDDNLQFLDNVGNAVFEPGPIIGVGISPWAVDPSDIDNDKDPDAAAANRGSNDVSVVVNLGGGSFDTPINLAVGDGPVDIAVVDLDQNGFADIATADNLDGTVSVILVSGVADALEFTPAVNLPVGDLPRSLTTIDLEGDLDRDIAVVANNDLGQRVVQVLRNDLSDGQLTFADAAELAAGENPVLVTTGDLDADDQDDLITVNEDVGASAAGGAGLPLATAQVRLGTCPWDCGAPTNEMVGVDDFLAMLAQWGQVGTSCDFDGNGVNVDDFLALIDHWGPCP